MPPLLSARDEPAATEPHPAILSAIFACIAIALTFPDLTRLKTFIAGDSGDSLLNLWILRSVQAAIPNGWDAFWNAPIYYPARDTLAYSDTLLPVALVDWPLRLVLGDVLALNMIYLCAWVLSSWCVYRLAMRVTHAWGPAIVASLAYTYSSIRLVHHQHFQLVVGGALVPLVLLALLRCLEAPSPRRGVWLGVAFSALALTAVYNGAMMAVVVVIVAAGWLLTEPIDRSRIGALAMAALAVTVFVAPIGAEYVRLQRLPEFRRGFDPVGAAHAEDFLSTGPDNYLLTHAPILASRSHPASRGIENRLFPGTVALVFGLVGAVVICRDLRRIGLRGHAREMALISLAGLVTVVLAFGDRYAAGGRDITLPFAWLRQLVPGFAGIRATARFALGGELALALLAAVGLDALLRRRQAIARTAVALSVAGFVVAESAMGLAFVRVPTVADDGGVGEALRTRPPGAVLELPIESSARGAAWPYVEMPRQLQAIRDGHPRVNGYSGFEPKDFAARVDVLNRFPAADALALSRTLGVRYVVLRTRLVGTTSPAMLIPQLDADGVGRYTDETAARMIGGIPPGSSVRIEHRTGGYIVELAP